MFLVELGSGKDQLYPSVRALGAAIRRGELGPQSRIYHRTTSRWLPITVHPEFRRMEAEREREMASRLRQRQWTFLPDGSGVQPGPEPRPETPVLIPGDPGSSWRQTLRSTFRRLRHRRSR